MNQMLFAEMAAEGWVMIIGAVGIIVTQVTSMILSYRREKDKAEKVEDVRRAARASDEKLDGLADVAKATHTLVNSEHGKALQAVADLARWKASQTRASADDLAASAAERALADHQSKQARVDRGGAK